MPEHTGRERPGGRTAETRRAVHDAVRRLQKESDAELSIPAVAASSGVHATTIYRRWRSIESLVLDVAVEDISAASPVPCTGDLEQDLRTVVPRLLNGIRREGDFQFLTLLLAAQATTRVGVAEIVEPRLAQFQAMLNAAAVTQIDAMDLMELIMAPAFFWAQLGQPLDPERDSDRLVRNALRSCRDRDAPGR